MPKGFWDDEDNDFLSTAGIEEVRAGFGPIITIAIDMSQAMEALNYLLAFFASLVPPVEEDIMRWEDDGGAIIGY
jgi:hypothetical protein